MYSSFTSGAIAGAVVVAFGGLFAASGAVAGPCEQIVDACRSAGFVAGQAKEGSGLWRDCVRPIVHGTAPPANTDKPVPAVPADVIAACKAKRPNFGEGHGGGKPGSTAPQG